MKKQQNPNGPLWQSGYVDPGDIFTIAEQDTYSQELRSFVRKCVRYTPSKRIIAKRLKGKILRRSGKGGVLGRAQGLRTGAILSTDANWLQGWTQTDTYAIGMALDDNADDG